MPPIQLRATPRSDRSSASAQPTADRVRTLQITVVVAVAAGLALAATFAFDLLTPRPRPVAMSLPSGPVGTQLAWVIEQLNGTGSPLTDDELAAHFTPSFLAAVPAAVLRRQFAEVGEGRRPFVLTRFIAPPSATGATAEMTTAPGSAAL